MIAEFCEEFSCLSLPIRVVAEKVWLQWTILEKDSWQQQKRKN